MNSERLWPEVVITGFFHLICLALAASCLLGVDPVSFIQSLSTISISAAALLAPAGIGASFFLGTLANRLLTDISIWYATRRKRVKIEVQSEESIRKARKDEPAEIACLGNLWVAKSFFRSAAAAGFIILFFSIFWTVKSQTWGFWAVVSILVFMLDIATIFAFFKQRKEHDDMFSRLKAK